MSEENPLEFVATCTIIEGWIWSAGTFEQLSLLADVVRIFVSSERFPEEKLQILEGARSLLGDKITYQKEKIAVEWLGENAHSLEEMGEISFRKPEDARYFLRNTNYLVPNITLLKSSPLIVRVPEPEIVPEPDTVTFPNKVSKFKS